MMVKPLWPVAEYIINYDYIVTNLCENRERPEMQCDGKCYLSKMFAKESKNDHNNPFAEGPIYEMPITICPSTDADVDSKNWSISQENRPIRTSDNLHSLLLGFEIIQPPEII